MPDTKISDLSSLTGANVAGTDEFVLVDKSDTTMAASGTDKRIVASELKIAMEPTISGKTALLGNETATGDVLLIEDVSATTNKKIALSELKTALAPKGHIWGLEMSNAADAANDITVAIGECTDDTGTRRMSIGTAITKRMDAAWVVGDAQGGLNTGAEAANTWYEVHVIMREDTGVVDVMFTTTGNRATLPANYTLKRRIGWIRNDAASAILAFSQDGDYFHLTTPINDIAATPTTTATNAALTVPPNSIARFRATTTPTAAHTVSQVTTFSEIDQGNITPADTTGLASLGHTDLAISPTAGHFELRVNASSQIEHDSAAATGTFDVSTFGWIDRRSRLRDS